ncbi:MAG: hypothetical protein ACYDBJ_19110 [Aggregatilineales bacterium]
MRKTLMYLTERIVDPQGTTQPMVGILPGKSEMTPRLTIGYREVRTYRDSWLWTAGQTLRGHQFHYSTWTPPGTAPAYELSDKGHEGAQLGSLIASYIHLHFLACPELAARFVNAAQKSTPWQRHG